MTQEKVIDLIKKFLALATSPEEHEAKAAMAKAQELMLRYSVSLDDAERQVIKTDRLDYQPRIPNEYFHIISNLIGQCFGCFVTSNQRENFLTIHGYETNIKVTHYTIDAIINGGVAEYRAEYRKHNSMSFRMGFWKGFCEGLIKKFGKEAQEGVVKYQPITIELSKCGTAKIVFHGGAGYDIGQAAGSRAELRAGVSGSGVKGELR